VFAGAGITFAIFGALTAFVVFSKIDFSFMGNTHDARPLPRTSFLPTHEAAAARRRQRADAHVPLSRPQACSSSPGP
jgi:hypothetical protein